MPGRLAKAGGETRSVEIPNGSVTGVSRLSIRLKSDDGCTRTYAITNSTVVAVRRDGIGSVKAGDQAWVTAMESGGTVTTIRMGDLSRPRSGPGDLPGPAGQRLVSPSRAGSATAFSGGLAGG